MHEKYRADIHKNLLRLSAFFLFTIFLTPDLVAQSCDPGKDGITPVGGGAQQLFNGEVCANKSVNPGSMRILYTNVDDAGDPNNVEFFIDWDDGTTQLLRYADGDISLISAVTGSYQADVNHLFPPAGPDVQCEYIPTTFLQLNGTLCPASASNPPPYVRWNTEDQITGNHLVAEQATGANVFEVCAGETITVRFSDQSTFNCVPPAYNNLVNNRQRWTQFIYGTTNTITSATGVEVGGTVEAYPFDGAVLNQPQPVTGPFAVSLDITIPADAQLGQEFEITMNSWNFCNRYDLGEAPVVTTGRILIIDSPPAPGVPPADYCEGDAVSATASGTGSGVLNWYADAGLATNVHTGATFDPINDPLLPANAIDTTIAFVDVLTRSYWVTETLGNNCEGPATEVVFTIYKQPTSAVAGPPQNVCTPTATMAANTPSRGTGQWSVISGPGTADNPVDPASPVSGMNPGSSTVFEWTITYGGICVSSDQVTITRDADPSPADAGPDVSLCTGVDVTMSAVNPAIGTGTWTIITDPIGTANIVSPNDPGTVINGLVAGNNYEFEWTVDNGSCPPTSDRVEVLNFLDPPADAGADFSICPPLTTAALSGSDPTPGTGMWTVVSGPVGITFDDDTDPNTNVNGVTANTVLRWSVSNGACADDATVTIDVDLPVDIADAGPDDSLCGAGADYILSAVPLTSPPASGVGEWTVVSGAGTFSNVNNPGATVSNLAVGPNVFEWTVTNSCGFTTSQVTITNESNPVADAGPDQLALCGVTSTLLAGNDPGTPIGTWSILSGAGGSFTDDTDPTTAFDGVLGETYVLNWAIDNGTGCPPTNDQVTIRFDEIPVADAGIGGTECDLDFDLAAIFSVGTSTGSWSVVSTPTGTETATFTDPNISNPSVTVSGFGDYTFEWEEVNGICTDTDQVIVTFTQQPVADAGAGGDECDLDFVFGGSFSVGGAAGQWTVDVQPPASVVTFLDDTDPTTSATVDTYGTYDFRWTETNGTCSDFDVITVNFFEQPVADAGADQDLCALSTTLSAVPTAGTGAWSIISPLDGTGSFSDPSLPNAVFTGDLGIFASKAYILRWTESNGTCNDFDEVTITLDAAPTTADAGGDQQVCGGTTTLAANLPLVGIGSWTVVTNPDGLGLPVNPTLNSSTFIGTAGETYELEWRITNGTCASSIDNVLIQFDEAPTTADAGPDRVICGVTHTLEANTPLIGNGNWVFLSNPDANGVIADPADPNSTFDGTAGISYVLQWEITNGVCPMSIDQVTITFGPPLPTPVIAGDPDACIGDIKTFTVPGGNPSLYNYTWNLSNLPPSTNVIAGSGDPFQFITLEFNDAFSADIEVTIDDKATGCIGSTESFAITVNQVPDMVLTSSDADLIICTGENVIFTATDNNGVATQFDFILNGVTVQSGPSNTFSTSSLPVVNSMVVVGQTGVCPSGPSPAVAHTLIPLPTVYNTNGGGNYCDGDVGQAVGLSGSQPGVTYELYLDGNPTGTTLVPGGGSFSFGPQTAAGDYTILATDVNTCSVQMNGVATVSIDPLPTFFNTTGGGTTCEGGTGVAISLDNSDNGFSYQLKVGGIAIGAPQAGTGTAISFGLLNIDGTYTVEATNIISGCTADMNGSATVVASPLPAVNETNNLPTICSSQNTNIVLNSTVPGSTFTWTAVVSDPGLTGASDQTSPVAEGISIVQTLVNTTSTMQTVTYTITPTGPVPLNCIGPQKVVEVEVNPAPTITFGTDDTICNGSQTALDFTMTGALPFTIVYNDGSSDITIANVAQTHFQPISPLTTTTYSIVSVTDGNGCSATSSETVTITVLDAIADFSTAQPLSDCTPYEITFDNNNILSGVSYIWSWGDGSPNDTTTSEPTIAHTFENNSTTLSLRYNVTLTARNDGVTPACTDVSNLEVEILPAIFTDIRPDITEGCAPVTINFDNQTLGAASHRWFYRVQGTNQENDVRDTPLTTYTLDNTGTSPIVYEVVYEAIKGSCSEMEITEVTVFPEVTADFTINGSDTPAAVSINDDPHATIVNTTLNASSWVTEWDYGDGNISNDPQPNSPYTYQNFGQYAVTLSVSDADGRCSDTKSIPFLVEPTTPIVQFSGDPLEGCAPLTVNFINESFSVDPDSYFWEFIAPTGEIISTSTEENPTFVFNNPGVYSVQLSGTNPLGTVVNEIKQNYITVFEVPRASFLTRPSRLFLPDGILYTQNLSVGGMDYLWDFGDGNTSELFEPEHTYAQVGQYDIALTVTSQDGCVDSTIVSQAVDVIEGGVVRVPNAFTPSLDGPSGGQPGGGTFNDIFLPIVEGVDDYMCQIFDRWGNLVFQSEDKNIGWDGYRNGKLLPTGVYVYKLSLRFTSGEKSERIGDVTLIR